MDVSVQEVDIASEDGTLKKYFLRVDCSGRDLGSGFQVLLTDGELAWRGEVTEDGVRCEAEELEMHKEKYVQDLHQALTGTESSVTYNFTLTPQPTSTTSTSTTTTTATTLAYEKVQKDISFRLGAVELGVVVEPSEAVRELLELGVQRASRLQRQSHHLQEENHTLRVEQKYITAELQRYAEGKQALEAELYSRFVSVLNHKKEKLRSLQQSLTQLQQDSTREESSEKQSSEKQSKATPSKEENSEDEYGGSTEEEEESRVEPAAVPATTTTASQEADSDYLLDDEVNDITDVAPCRKRRIRNLAVTSDPAAKRAPQRMMPMTTPTSTSSRQKPGSPAGGSAAAAGQQKASRQQRSRKPASSPSAEDLFDDF